MCCNDTHAPGRLTVSGYATEWQCYTCIGSIPCRRKEDSTTGFAQAHLYCRLCAAQLESLPDSWVQTNEGKWKLMFLERKTRRKLSAYAPYSREITMSSVWKAYVIFPLLHPNWPFCLSYFALLSSGMAELVKKTLFLMLLSSHISKWHMSTCELLTVVTSTLSQHVWPPASTWAGFRKQSTHHFSP